MTRCYSVSCILFLWRASTPSTEWTVASYCLAGGRHPERSGIVATAKRKLKR